MEITHTLPKHQTQNYTVTSKVQFLQLQQCLSSKSNEHNPSHVPTTHAATSTISTSHNSISPQYSQPFMSLAAPKANQYSMLQIKSSYKKPCTSTLCLTVSHNQQVSNSSQIGKSLTNFHISLKLHTCTYNKGLYARMLRAILNKSWRQYPTKQQLCGHLLPITKTIKVWRTRPAEHCWRCREELIRDVLLWTSSHGRAKAGRPARTYIQ